MGNPSNSACSESIARLDFRCVNPLSQVGGEKLLVGLQARAFGSRLTLQSPVLGFWPSGISRLADTQKQEKQSCRTFRVSEFHKTITHQFGTSLGRLHSIFPGQLQ